MTEPIEPAKKGDIDAYASLSLQISALEGLLEKLRPGIEALGKGVHEGHVHAVNVQIFDQSKVSTTLAKKFLTPAEIQRATVTNSVTRILIVR